MSLLFSVAELRSELDAFRIMAAGKLFAGSDGALRGASAQLLGIAKSRSGQTRWAIEPTNAVITQPSVGDYMPDGRGGLMIYGEITFKWELEPVRRPGDTRAAKIVRLDGIASTRVRILEGDPSYAGQPRELAVWRMELADSNSPGAFFHVQILGRDHDTIFPKDLDIPRLPGVINSPFACMEFVLGELFQEEWPRIAQRESAEVRDWRAIQARRHGKHLDWAARQLSECSGSPWAAWKAAKPDENLFLD